MAALASIPNPFAFVRGRFQKWWQSKLPFTDSVQLTQRNVYILPTRPGLMLGVTLLVLLVASINYQLNLGYLLTFLLAGSALVGMHVCHGTLRGLAMNLVAPPAHYAGAVAIFDVKLMNARRTARHGIGLSVLNPTTWTHKKALNGIGPGPTCPPRAAAWCRSLSRRPGAACTAFLRSRPRRVFRWAPSASGRSGGRRRKFWCTRRPNSTRRPCRPVNPAQAALLPPCARKTAANLMACAVTAAATR